MFLMIGMMLTGVLVGFLSRRHRFKEISYLVTVLIWMLLFILGTEVGANEQIVSGLHTLGVEATIIMLGGVFGSAIAAGILWYLMNRKRGVSNEG